MRCLGWTEIEDLVRWEQGNFGGRDDPWHLKNIQRTILHVALCTTCKNMLLLQINDLEAKNRKKEQASLPATIEAVS